ncbi:cytochrome P450 [Gracilibacillus dipsosauri]|uniref:cytochrome P450 n=1 Tax=Gracilibacillus dipsosauri TaxID=178340 RepID=UPI002409C32C
MSSEEINMPKEKGIDHTLQLLKEGYTFIQNRKNKYESRIFETKLLGEKVICMVGKEQAKLFYDNEKFERKGAAPKRLQKTLLGEGGVQGLDENRHHHRKAMFMSLMTREMLKEIQELTEAEWSQEISRHSAEQVTVYDMAKHVLTRVAMQWTGIPLDRQESEKWVDELSAMFENASNVGPKHWKARRSRSKAEKWLKQLIEDIRKEKIKVAKSSPIYQFAWHQGLDGNLLDKQTAAVEVLNLLRPIVAISVYVDFTILAVHQYPEQVDKLHQKEFSYENFIQEVRRYYPFFPFATARVKQDFIWNDYPFKKGTLTLLDLYGTNHDPSLWEAPDQFNPSRFKEWEGSPFDFIPQGGGEYDIGHRCAGEFITLAILKVTLKFFLHDVSYQFPKQDLEYSMSEIPSLPESKVTIIIA